MVGQVLLGLHVLRQETESKYYLAQGINISNQTNALNNEVPE